MAEQPTKKKQWILNGFTMSTPGHLAPGLWRHPRNRSAQYTDLEYWTDMAKVLESGKIHSIFIADVLGPYDVYKGPDSFDPGLPGVAQIPMADPFLPIAAMAAVTKNLSFGITASTTYENPHLLARRFATLDHLTKGRVAWNAVTSHLESAARNVGLETQIAHDERYKMADEYLNLTYKLWESSWRDDAVVKDAEQYAVPGRVRRIDHRGEYFKSAGPLTTEPSIQRTPFIFQAGTSTAGKAFATKHAECMFLAGLEPTAVRKSVEDIRARAIEHGRDPNSIKTITGILVIVDETDEKAQAKWEDYLQYVDLEGAATLFGGWTGTDLSRFDDEEDFRFTGPGAIQSLVNAWTATVPGTDGLKWTKKRVAQEIAIGGPHARAIGSPSTVADILERWIEESGIDGFNLSYAIAPADFEDIVKYLLPELRRRGVFWDDYVATTTRENFLQDGKGPRLRDDHPGSQYKWAAE
ncbi:Putative Alkanesulfonate monooxygenase [Aspergillus calidoustus]|uniref:Putative Alkanesulfonate monooxygenase n=1 Tax=Aspergillus calidoustus TaxID=454130 RepID=A0A0U5C670_ASPCI|nr:Putative Alkanesulfonate monooxygenase [Aspergillus calidoustus]